MPEANDVLQRFCTSRAFTLLEMLVALAIMAVLAAALYASLGIGFHARARAEAAAAPTRALAVALDMIQRDMTCALPPRGVLAGPFTGEDGETETSGEPSDAVTFFADIEGSGAEKPGIRKVEFLVTTSEDGIESVLVRRVTDNLLAPVEEEPVETVICRDVRLFNLSYFDGSEWQETWDSVGAGDVLPLAVHVQLDVGPAAEDDNESEVRQLTRVFPLPAGEPAGAANASGQTNLTGTGRMQGR